MTTRDPNLQTLLAWSHELAASRPCADWEDWHAASPRAARQWELLAQAEQRLARGQAPLAAAELGAADVADYLDGELPPVAAREFEQACWSSPAQLCEVVSAAQFGRESTELAEVSSDLSQRLLAIGPKAAERRRRRALRLAEVQLAAESSTPPQVASDAVIARPRRHVARREVDVLRTLKRMREKGLIDLKDPVAATA